MHMEDDFILMQRYEADLLGWCNSILTEYDAKVASFNLSWNTEDHGKVKALSWKDGSALCMLVKACLTQKAMSTEEDVDDTIDIQENSPVHNLNEAKRKAADELGIRLRFNALKLIGCKNTHCSLRKTFVRPIVDESSKEEGGLCRSCIPDELTIIQVRLMLYSCYCAASLVQASLFVRCLRAAQRNALYSTLARIRLNQLARSIFTHAHTQEGRVCAS